MTTAAPPAGALSIPVRQDATTKHLRGSSLLLVGRLLALVLSSAIQVATVRYLSKSDYGALAYALSVVALGASIALFGLDKAITRFVPIYHERRDYDRLFGTVVIVAATISAIGLVMLWLVFSLQGWIARSFLSDRQSLRLLLLLIALSPLRAFDCLLSGLFSIFADARALLFPRYLMVPGLQLAMVLSLIWGHASVYCVGIGYLVTDLLGTALSVFLLLRLLRRQGLLRHFRFRSLRMPAGAIFSFSLPLLTSDLVFVLRNTVAVMLLEHFHGTVDVAAFRAVLPIARLNMVVFQSFMLLFMPCAVRMFARNDRGGISRLYWQSATWIAVMSFPIFALTFSLARPLTVTLYGSRYAQSAILLALLSLGHYFDAALGFNGLTLRVYGRVRYLATVDLMGALVGFGVNVLLIARYGTLGAASGACLTLVAQNLLYQFGLRRGAGLHPFDRHYLPVYVSIGAAALGLLLFQCLTSAPAVVGAAAAGLLSVLVIRWNSKRLSVEQTFPELLRYPLLRRLLRA